MTQWFFAALHLFGLGIGLGAIWWRYRALTAPLGPAGLRTAFNADAAWGIAAAIWIITGLLRAFGGLEKGSDYYLHNTLFHAKMGCLALILLLELWPMITLVRWRIQLKKGDMPDTTPGVALGRISLVQTVLVLVMVVLATGMARGHGAGV